MQNDIWKFTMFFPAILTYVLCSKIQNRLFSTKIKQNHAGNNLNIKKQNKNHTWPATWFVSSSSNSLGCELFCKSSTFRLLNILKFQRKEKPWDSKHLSMENYQQNMTRSVQIFVQETLSTHANLFFSLCSSELNTFFFPPASHLRAIQRLVLVWL